MDQEIKQGFENIKQEFESLTQIIKESFDGVENKIGGLENKIGGLENKIGGLEKTMNEGFKENAQEHQIMHQKLEDIELRLGNTAYAFEVQELDKRLIKVEKKLGFEV